MISLWSLRSALVIQDAPSIETFVVFYHVSQRSIRVESAPKLTFLAYMSLESLMLRIGIISVEVEYASS
jgi:hypothetical protein